MKPKKNGYTLLEIMIVLGIIIIIMTITMKFSSSRIDDLHAQTSKDDFKNSYEQILLGNMSSNYHNKERYDKMIISMISGANGFTYTLENSIEDPKIYTGYYDPKQTITKITINDEESHELKTELTPYEIGCKINDLTGTAIIQTKAKNRDHCFRLTTNMCKLEYVKCVTLP